MKTEQEKTAAMTRQLSHSSSSLPDGGLVLLIDDEEVIREIGCEMLSSLGMPCVVAENGEEGIALYEKNRDKIILVILDVELPGISGEKVYDTLRRMNPDLKIILASGYGKEYLEARFFKRKLDNFMPKPFQLNKLTTTINQLLAE